ncbi:MAG: hypothetical protein R6W71_01380 [Bacteroidales bacterium]|jgi:hypothetical protein
MKKILVLYYTQTGQLRQIIDSVAAPLVGEFQVIFEELKPDPPFPFPWNGMPFFQAFPESVKEIPCGMESLQVDPDEHFDLVILAYQVWYLSPSIPVSAFLQSPEAKKILNGRPVITLLGVRNMWVMAHERVKARMAEAGGRLVGNIVLNDPAPNLTSVITIVRWMMKGEKGAFRKFGLRFPEAGVPEASIEKAFVYGEIIKDSLLKSSFDNLQSNLISAGAVKIDPVLTSIEKRGKMMFGIWAKMILKKGGYNDPEREGRLRLFKYYLFSVIYLVSPFASCAFRLYYSLNRRAASRIIRKYSTGMESL